MDERPAENGVPTRVRSLEHRANRLEVELAVVRSELKSVQEDAAELMKMIRSNQARIIAVLSTLTAALIGGVIILVVSLRP